MEKKSIFDFRLYDFDPKVVRKNLPADSTKLRKSNRSYKYVFEVFDEMDEGEWRHRRDSDDVIDVGPKIFKSIVLKNFHYFKVVFYSHTLNLP